MSSMSYPSLDKFCMLLVNNNRSKAYLQSLVNAGHIPTGVVVLDSGGKILPEHTANDAQIFQQSKQKFIRECKEVNLSFDEKEHIQKTLEVNNIPFVVKQKLDVNCEDVVSAVREMEGKYLIYSGPGGTILRDDILSAGKHILHVHPGWLPDFRGSTTVYYSLLAGEGMGCSVIEMVKEIDQGPVFHRKKVQWESTEDMDYVLDPALRASALLEFFNANKGKEPKPQAMQEESEGRVFYIIHPVLKHLSILSKEKRVCP